MILILITNTNSFTDTIINPDTNIRTDIDTYIYNDTDTNIDTNTDTMDTDSYYRYYYQSKPILICENTTVTYYRYWILSLILIIISILYAELTVIEHQSTQVVISRKTRSGAKQSFEPIYLAVEYVTCIVTPSYGSYHCF